jgi:PEP-CTERM motif-containing protein
MRSGIPWEEDFMLRLLSRIFSLAACGAFVLGAGSASALSTVYTVDGFSSMAQDNTAAGGSCTFATCNVPVTGTVTIDDDGVGNVTLTNVSVAHNGYQVGPAGLISIVIDRDSISLGAGPVLGSGSTISSVVSFPATSFAQVGTTTCTAIVFPCALAGLPDGVSPLTSPIPISLGNWTFNNFGGWSAQMLYTNQAGAKEVLTLGAVPEPNTIALVAAGLVGLAIRRRSSI